MKPTVPLLLSINAGYVDTAGFLALHGLFTAHVTGNFVTLGASLVLGTTGAIAKLLALPMFCVVVVLVRLLRYGFIARHIPVMKTMLMLMLLLLIIGGALAIGYGPFTEGDSASAIITGLTLVSAMAIQNAAHRVHLASSPPSTLMTGTTTQIMLDLADKLHGVPTDQRAAIHTRLSHMAASVLVFALGCAAAALSYALVNVWCFAIPPLFAIFAYATYEETPA
ncbi:YoaK family protein [Dyella tabacisoli]|uniref:DUF1275 domain-containing protein n=1 Tax=Dyella tabacisoli TaxID=2282381 RepID=A0A369UR21_9GAMM|nr:DUF1275 family protein [Dyella tabacisoli]RDD83096.1 DUF1275 domain-containing protein [Dyella tabacisoli]